MHALYQHIGRRQKQRRGSNLQNSSIVPDAYHRVRRELGKDKLLIARIRPNSPIFDSFMVSFCQRGTKLSSDGG